MLDETGGPLDLVIFPIRLALFFGFGALLSWALALLLIAAGALLRYAFDLARAWRAEGQLALRTVQVAGLVVAGSIAVMAIGARAEVVLDWWRTSGTGCCLGDASTPEPWDAPTPMGGYP
jgi:hypothetical protein